MLKNKSAILLLAMAIVCLLSTSVFATESNIAVDFRKALATGGNVTLKENITVTDSSLEALNVISSDTTVNFGDKTFTLDAPYTGGPNWLGIRINSGNVVFNGTTGGITVANTADNGANIGEFYDVVLGTTKDPANLTINGGRYIAGTSAVSVNKGTLTIEGGYFKALCGNAKFLLNCYDANFKNGSAKIIVKGGTFVNFNPSEYYGEPNQPISLVAEGYKVVSKVIDANTTEYSVVVDEAYEFKKALATGGNVTLKENITVTDSSLEALNVISSDTTVNFGDKTFTLDAPYTGGPNWLGIRINSGNVVFNGTTGGITVANTADNGANIGEFYDVVLGTTKDPANLTINGGRYIAGTSAVSVNKGTLTIEGGYFKALCGNAKFLLNCYDANFKNGSAKIIVKGGTFVNFNPSEYYGEPNQPISLVAEGYKVDSKVIDANTTEYSVVCAHPEEKLTHVKAVEATYTTDGNIEYYKCTCGKKVDASKNEVEKVVIPMLIQVSEGNASVGDVVVDEAIKDAGNSSVVEIPAVGNATSVTVKVDSLKDVDEANKGLTVETKDTTVTLDAKAVEEVAKQAGNATNITIEVTKTEEKTLNKEQKEAIKDKEVAIVLSAKILADGKEISNFNGGKVKVEIPFTPAEGTKGSDYKVYYVADDGKVTAIPTRYVKEKLVVELEHFSEYVVVKEVATAAPAPSAPAANPNEKDNTPKTGAVSVIGLVVAMSVIGLAVLRKRD